MFGFKWILQRRFHKVVELQVKKHTTDTLVHFTSQESNLEMKWWSENTYQTKTQLIVSFSCPIFIRKLKKFPSVPQDGKEKSSETFEILCGGEKSWDYSRVLNRDMHVAGGRSPNGEILYVCRADEGKQKTPGYYNESNKNCCVPSYSKENCKKENFALLVNNCWKFWMLSKN